MGGLKGWQTARPGGGVGVAIPVCGGGNDGG